MRPKWMWLPSLAVVLAAAAGCGDGGPLERMVQPAEGPAAARSTSLQKMEGQMPAFSISKVIGPEGGSIGGEDYRLTVPRGAVAQPTTFAFRSVDNGYMEVVLTATRVGSTDTNDVGRVGFGVPLVLSFRVDAAGGLPRWSRLVVVWVRPDGTLEPVPSSINPRTKVLTGRLTHFTGYAVAGGD